MLGKIQDALDEECKVKTEGYKFTLENSKVLRIRYVRMFKEQCVDKMEFVVNCILLERPYTERWPLGERIFEARQILSGLA